MLKWELSRAEQSFFGGEKRLSRAEHDFLRQKNLSLREMTLDKEKNSLTCKKTLAKKYKYDRIQTRRAVRARKAVRAKQRRKSEKGESEGGSVCEI